MVSERALVEALRRIAAVRRAAEAREIATAALGAHEREQRRNELIRRLPSGKPITPEEQARRYRKAVGR